MLQAWTLRRPLHELLLFYAPLLFILGLVLLKLRNPPLYWHLFAREDGPIEYLTSLVYLLSGLVALAVSRRFHQQEQRFFGTLYLLLSLGFFFICMEEISWGQRLFGVSSPELFETYNQQGEINLHNFADRHLLHGAYIIISGFGAFAHLIVSRVGFPLQERALTLLVPGSLLFFYFFAAFALYAYYDYLSPLLVGLFGPEFGYEYGPGVERFMIAKDQEPVELILSAGFLLFVTSNWRQQVAGAYRNPSLRVAKPVYTPAAQGKKRTKGHNDAPIPVHLE